MKNQSIKNTTLNIKELKTVYDNAKSFYKKAKYIDLKNSITLISYNTKILTISKNTHKIKRLATVDAFSQTTLRHAKEFLKQFATAEYFNYTKKDILNIKELKKCY